MNFPEYTRHKYNFVSLHLHEYNKKISPPDSNGHLALLPHSFFIVICPKHCVAPLLVYISYQFSPVRDNASRHKKKQNKINSNQSAIKSQEKNRFSTHMNISSVRTDGKQWKEKCTVHFCFVNEI